MRLTLKLVVAAAAVLVSSAVQPSNSADVIMGLFGRNRPLSPPPPSASLTELEYELNDWEPIIKQRGFDNKVFTVKKPMSLSEDSPYRYYKGTLGKDNVVVACLSREDRDINRFKAVYRSLGMDANSALPGAESIAHTIAEYESFNCKCFVTKANCVMSFETMAKKHVKKYNDEKWKVSKKISKQLASANGYMETVGVYYIFNPERLCFDDKNNLVLPYAGDALHRSQPHTIDGSHFRRFEATYNALYTEIIAAVHPSQRTQ
ncbi:hypothetical protein SYNPS1DRAFT_31239 [Syncephalis pseudoplumigaleata]|uniref:Uncharacterized protein n=1 Tax=Syncephalis pseudoplumigaleata TaxID=1712513 RepID=A0A4P9YTL2_9FUNG|nr:hypothetical protein SYNPS1DRAFT_31239 [Syncephalis pseudoplumigaleata]|eukprot:RKP23068.1 hypothetical protein SYNPS1DRAFT_31239 [Syncephalis pseudoplumigaleata]